MSRKMHRFLYDWFPALSSYSYGGCPAVCSLSDCSLSLSLSPRVSVGLLRSTQTKPLSPTR